jgi:hypothetical protein
MTKLSDYLKLIELAEDINQEHKVNHFNNLDNNE